MRAIDLQRVEQAGGIGRHVGEQVRGLDLLALHQSGEGAHQVGHAPPVEVRRQADISVVVAHDEEALGGQPLAQRFRPEGQLGAEAHDEQQGRILAAAERLVLDLDTVCLRACHASSRVVRQYRPRLAAHQ